MCEDVYESVCMCEYLCVCVEGGCVRVHVRECVGVSGLHG